MLAEIRKLIRDAGILRLIESWLKSRVREGNRTRVLTRGVPQGSPLSPLLSNLYLDHLDEALMEENLRLVRFADDFLVLCKNEKRAKRALDITEDVLAALKLRINRDKTRLVDFNRGFRFLGVEFIRSLAFKSKYPETGRAAAAVRITPPQRGANESPPVPAEPPEEAMATMPQAFAQAVQQEGEFTSADEYADSLPDFVPLEEAEPPPAAGHGQDVLVPRSTEMCESGHDPRLRTLYLMEHGCVLAKESERLVVKKDGAVIREIPAIKVDMILVFGNAQITIALARPCASRHKNIHVQNTSDELLPGGKNTHCVAVFRRALLRCHRRFRHRSGVVAPGSIPARR